MTKKIFSDAQAVVKEMRKNDEGRNRKFQNMEDMYNCISPLPSVITDLQWVRPVIGTDPHDNVRAGTRILSALDPEIRFLPMLDNQETKQRANEIDRMLRYWLKAASKRTQGNLIADLVQSCLQYDMVAAYVDYVPYQKRLAPNSKSWKMGNKFGPYIISLKNPKDVHFRYSDVGLEHVVYQGDMKLRDIAAYWGKDNKGVAGLLSKYDKPDDYNKEFVFVDSTDLDTRLVWVEEKDGNGVAAEIYNLDNDIPFWRWAVRAGGTKLATNSADQYTPLNDSIYKSKQWEDDNLIQSLAISEKIAIAASPRTTIFGVTEVETDYQEPLGLRKVSNPDPNSVRDTPPLEPDQGLLQLHELYQAAMAKSGLPRVMQGGDLPSNTPFASANLLLQIGMGAVRPYRELAEISLGDICETMCRWVKYDNNAISVLGNTPDIGSMLGDAGHTYTLEPDDINEDYLCVMVELKPDVPTDRQARANTAAMMVAQLGYPLESALSELGDSDPAKTMKQGMFEKLVASKLEMRIEKDRIDMQTYAAQKQAEIQMQVQQQQMAQQQQMQQEQMAQQQQTQPPSQAQNPAMGGLPPAMGNPSQTREQQTGATQDGLEVA
jgi:hypothetical protein